MRNRAYRRHQKHRWERRTYSQNSQGNPGWLSDPRHIGREASCRARCSKACCGNPRKFYGTKTRPEYASEMAQVEGVAEYFGHNAKLYSYKKRGGSFPKRKGHPKGTCLAGFPNRDQRR